MRVKTSITLPPDLVRAIDERVGKAGNRSLLIEVAVRSFIGQQERAERDARDRALIDRHADELNREAADALAYQVWRR